MCIRDSPHSMANAVVEEARRRGLTHEERHARVEYLVAHGIASSVAVSYTHLDVYKRQVWVSMIGSWWFSKIACFSVGFSTLCLVL